MVYQLISLNVAVNSYDHALLTLLVSNQFVEIKGSVFKKFEKDSLFQITCAGACSNPILHPGLLTSITRHRREVHFVSDAGNCCVPKSHRTEWKRIRLYKWICPS